MNIRLLFDEDCSKVFASGRAEIEKKYPDAICVGYYPDLQKGTKDQQILEYALQNHYVIVTRDARFVKECCDKHAKVGVLKGNRIFFIESAEQILGNDIPPSLFSPD